MRYKINILFIGIFFTISSLSASQLYLLPRDSDDALSSILQSIDHSKKSIKIMIYNFTHKKIANRLKIAAKRGVKVQIIFDKATVISQKRRTMFYYLAKYKNISIYKLKGKRIKQQKRNGIMHLKTAIFDHKRVIFGSANWTYSAFGKNYEFLYVEDDYALGKKFTIYFEDLKQKSEPFR